MARGGDVLEPWQSDCRSEQTQECESHGEEEKRRHLPGVQAASTEVQRVRRRDEDTPRRPVCSGDARGKKGLEVVTESPKDLKLEHCFDIMPLLHSHLHSVCPKAKAVPTGHHRRPSQLNCSQGQPPDSPKSRVEGLSWVAKEDQEGWGSTAIAGRECLTAFVPVWHLRVNSVRDIRTVPAPCLGLDGGEL